MTDLIKSNVEGLEFQTRGVLVATDNVSYNNYVKQRKLHTTKDSKIQELEHKINILNSKLDTVLNYIESNK